MRIFAAAAFLALSGCGPPPDAQAPAPIEPKPGASCASMCAHLQQLDCPEGKPTEGGASCEEVCLHAMAEGFDPHPECVIAVERCADVDRASQGCQAAFLGSGGDLADTGAGMTDRIFGSPALHTPRTDPAGLPAGVQGDVLYHNGAAWVPLNAGVNGQLLQTQGPAADPQWATVTGLPAGVQGDILYHNGAAWVVLNAGNNGEVLQTQGAGANPQWAAGGETTGDNIIPPPEAPASAGVATFTQATFYRGATFRLWRPTSFNRMSVHERAGSTAGRVVTIGMYQGATGGAVDPWPLVASMSVTMAGAAGVLTATPSEGTVTLDVGPILLLSLTSANIASFTAYQHTTAEILNSNVPAGNYPTNFLTALGGALPATVAYASLAATTLDTALAHRLYTV